MVQDLLHKGFRVRVGDLRCSLVIAFYELVDLRSQNADHLLVEVVGGRGLV